MPTTHRPPSVEHVTSPSHDAHSEENEDSVNLKGSSLSLESAIEMENKPASSDGEADQAQDQHPREEIDSSGQQEQMKDFAAQMTTSSNLPVNFGSALTTSLIGQTSLTNAIISCLASLSALIYWSINYAAELQKSSESLPLSHPLKLTPCRPSLWTRICQAPGEHPHLDSRQPLQIYGHIGRYNALFARCGNSRDTWSNRVRVIGSYCWDDRRRMAGVDGVSGSRVFVCLLTKCSDGWSGNGPLCGDWCFWWCHCGRVGASFIEYYEAENRRARPKV
jgi:hypothetical protein